MIDFKSLGLAPNILKAIEELGFETPTPIQEKVIPVLLSQESDIVGLAQTGTGKTAAFGLPALQQIDIKNRATQVLIISPTRELCMQICKDLERYSKYIDDIAVVAVYGGASIENQIKQLKRGSHIIVSTPGRIFDLLKRKRADISQIKTLILDEADEMLNMGFRDDLEAILEFAPEKRQTLLFSATMPAEVARISKKFLTDPIEISVGKKNSGTTNVDHQYMIIHERDRYLALRRVIDFYPGLYALVFCRTRTECQMVATNLMQEGYSADTLHGDLSQAQRDYAMSRFRSKGIRILVATDVAARGLDVSELTHVINYNLPDDQDVYIHRSGRTGRANNNGLSVTFINIKEKFKIKSLEKSTGREFTQKEVPSGNQICEQRLMHTIDEMLDTEVNDKQISTYISAFEDKLENIEKDEIIKRFLSVQFNHFYDQYKNAPDLNVSMDRGFSGDSDGYTRLFINIGRVDDLDKGMLKDYIKDIARTEIEFKDVDMRDKFSIFTIKSDAVEAVKKAFANINFEGRKLRVDEMDRDNNSRGGGSRGGDGGNRRREGGGGGFSRGGGERRGSGGYSGSGERRSSGGGYSGGGGGNRPSGGSDRRGGGGYRSNSSGSDGGNRFSNDRGGERSNSGGGDRNRSRSGSQSGYRGGRGK
ncbi:MAG: DEAD/DEAH box helicase [Bacteroidota bacterium]